MSCEIRARTGTPIGFDKLELTDNAAVESHAYAHYLHHKYFAVNYGGAGLVPLDKWFGTWHDGTKDGDARMQARFEKKKARLNAARNTAIRQTGDTKEEYQ